MPELRFDEAEHRYYLDGRRLPSVTQVLEDVGIIDYSKIPHETRETALERGRVVHLLTELDDLDELDESTVDPQLAGYLEAWRRFRCETGFTPELIEHRQANAQYGFAGTLDRTGRFRGATVVDIADLKTGTAPAWTRWQMAAYASFFPTPRTYRRYAVELHNDGTYAVPFVFEGRDWSADFNGFLSCLNVFRMKHPNFGSEEKRRTA